MKSQVNHSKVERIQRKVELQVYLHLEHLLPKSHFHFIQKPNFSHKPLSKQQTVNFTINYLNNFSSSIQNLPHRHHKQLLFLLDIFTSSNRLILNHYYVHVHYEDTFPYKFYYLGFDKIKQRIDVEKLMGFKNWSHLVFLSFNCCGWFGDNDWRALVENADKFANLQWLDLENNMISEIKEGDIEQFKDLESIDLWYNPLTEQTTEILKIFQQNNYKIKVQFEE